MFASCAAGMARSGAGPCVKNARARPPPTVNGCLSGSRSDRRGHRTAWLRGPTGPLRSGGAGGARRRPERPEALMCVGLRVSKGQPLAEPMARVSPRVRPASGRPALVVHVPPLTPSRRPGRVGPGPHISLPRVASHGRGRIGGPGPFWRRAGLPCEPPPGRSPMFPMFLPSLPRPRS